MVRTYSTCFFAFQCLHPLPYREQERHIWTLLTQANGERRRWRRAQARSIQGLLVLEKLGWCTGENALAIAEGHDALAMLGNKRHIVGNHQNCLSLLVQIAQQGHDS